MYIKHGKIKFSYRDSYDMEPLGTIIADWLKNFRDTIVKRNKEGNCIGVPSSVLAEAFGEEWYTEQSVNGGLTDEHIELGFNYWIAIIDQMIYSFEMNEPEYQGSLSHTISEDGQMLIDRDEELWQKYMEECERHEEKCKEGRALFAKHFCSLWW